MKIARFFSYIFAGIGILLLLGSVGFLLLNREAPVRIRELPREALAVSDAFAQALHEGDLETAAQLMYGQPDLGVGDVPENPESALVWEAFRSSISFAYSGECTVEQSGLVRTGSITTLDVTTVMEKLPERTQTLIDQKIAAAADLTELYDEVNNFREDLTARILREALQQALSQDSQSVTREVTVRLVNRDGGWWIVPHQNLLQILTGLA